MKIVNIIRLALTNPINFLRKLYGRILRFYKLYIVKDSFTLEVTRWFRDRGDETLRLDYPLTEKSVVFDLGGYVGDFADEICKRYGCRVYVFEPHPRFYDKCVARFKSNPNILVFNYGVSDVDGQLTLTDSINGSSFLQERKGETTEIVCNVRDFFSVINELDIEHIDLMKINIEGGEFPLMEHIAKQGRLSLTNNYQIQFHNFVTNATERRNSIVGALEQYHKRTWCYEFVWENWERVPDISADGLLDETLPIHKKEDLIR